MELCTERPKTIIKKINDNGDKNNSYKHIDNALHNFFFLL